MQFCVTFTYTLTISMKDMEIWRHERQRALVTRCRGDKVETANGIKDGRGHVIRIKAHALLRLHLVSHDADKHWGCFIHKRQNLPPQWLILVTRNVVTMATSFRSAYWGLPNTETGSLYVWTQLTNFSGVFFTGFFWTVKDSDLLNVFTSSDLWKRNFWVFLHRDELKNCLMWRTYRVGHTRYSEIC